MLPAEQGLRPPHLSDRSAISRARVVLAILLLTAGAAAGATGAVEGAAGATPAFEVSATAPTPAQIAHGKQLAQSCAACHGLDGNATSTQFPKLASQRSDYIAQELRRFKSASPGKKPERVNPIMNGVAATLSPQDMRDLAYYYSREPIKPAIAANAQWAKLGEGIWRGGIADRRVPACAACHGPGGLGLPGQYPRLAGQWSEYVAAQLHAFRTGARGDNTPMHDIASRMSDRQIRDVSDFVAGLR
ncbi:MAG: cytochrome c4 [Betaproteobacteria bacterium]|nr:cytochrome c4 [Betaproteobacteria bacterium]MDE2123772.1 cytochrome c4 [Betaproteobacteria bacterium]MDE2185156.1 cytochrome c4 [Betaproteobacteria bacterium]